MQFVAEGADARVRDDDVEPAELFHTAVHQGFERVVVTHVDLRGHDAAILGLDQVGGFGEVVRCRVRVSHVVDRSADVERDDVGALLRQPHRVAAALTPRGTADQGDLALYPPGHHATTVGSVSQPRTVDVGLSLELARSTFPLGEAFEDFLEGDPAFEPRQR